MTHFFDVIKKEVQSDDECEISFTINGSNDVKQEQLYKEELDISWTEGDHGYGFVEENCNNVNNLSYKISYPRVLLERLPDEVVNNAGSKWCSTTRYENEPKKLDASGSQKKSFLQYYHRCCTTCKTKKSSNQKNQKCKICNIRLNYECKKCSKILSSYGGIVYHLKVECMEKGNYYKCLKCNYQSINKYNVNVHFKRVHTASDSLNHIAKLESENVQKYVISTAKLHRCSKCGKGFRRLMYLLKHTQVCGQVNNTAKNVVASATVVQDNCLHHCVKCNRTVKNDKLGSFYLKKCRHCHSKFSFKCKKCEQIFHSYNGINHHIKARHTVNSDLFKCPECDYETHFFSYLTKHVQRTHTLETHECSKCGQKFKNRDAFKNHSLYCQKESEFQYDHCSYKSMCKMRLKSHTIDVHTTGNEVACPKCAKYFSNEYLNSHTKNCGKEPLRCDLCDFHTLNKKSLKRHIINRHSEGNEIDCSKCGRTCKNQRYLSAHLRRCGTDPHLQCDRCSYKTKYKFVLRKHVERYHTKKRRLV